MKPGNPPPNGIKFVCTADVLELLEDRSWLTKVTNTINQHWHKMNGRKNGHFVMSGEGLNRAVFARRTI